MYSLVIPEPMESHFVIPSYLQPHLFEKTDICRMSEFRNLWPRKFGVPPYVCTDFLRSNMELDKIENLCRVPLHILHDFVCHWLTQIGPALGFLCLHLQDFSSVDEKII